jgi:hypothetical protein
MREKLQGEVAPLQKHPSSVASGFDEAQRAVKLRGPFEVVGRQVRRRKITHASSPRLHPAGTALSTRCKTPFQQKCKTGDDGDDWPYQTSVYRQGAHL